MVKIDARGAGVFAAVVGSVQDGGLPHAGCRCENCQRAWADPAAREYVVSLALVDARGEQAAVYLIDATPDIKFQLEMVGEWLGPHPQRPQRINQPAAIFLTHAHMGHVAGLSQLSFESMAVQHLPVYGSAKLMKMLQETELWRPLVSQLDLRPIADQQPIALAEGLTITPILVPHRDEWRTGTYGFIIEGPTKRLFYMPDIDSLEQWAAAETVLNRVDVALIDAAFYDAGELRGRAAVRHASIHDTLAFWEKKQIGSQLVLTHFNHTNPLLNPAALERKVVEEAGAILAETGMVFALD